MGLKQPHEFEREVVEFFSRFASVEELPQRRRWEVERASDAAFNNSHEDKEACGNLSGSPAAIAKFGDAVARYDEVVASRAKHQYVVIPEEPRAIAFACDGVLPTFADLRSLAPRADLPFGLTIVDADAKWSLMLAREIPGLAPWFVERLEAQESDVD